MCAVIPLARQRTHGTTFFRVATPGAESAVHDCLVVHEIPAKFGGDTQQWLLINGIVYTFFVFFLIAKWLRCKVSRAMSTL